MITPVEALNGFNIRVYGICIRDNKILVLKEKFLGKDVTKLPGGGLEFGEGPEDCLHREFMEELNVTITIKDCFFIQPHYVQSLAKDNKQIVMLYYIIDIPNTTPLDILDPRITALEWAPLSHECPLSLPVDQLMYKKLLNTI